MIELLLAALLWWSTPTTITYECDPVLEQAVRVWTDASGLRDGGCSETPTISLEVRNPWPWGDTFAVAETNADSCRIVQRFEGLSVLMLAHEVGHCVGLAHSSSPGTLMSPNCCPPGLTRDDITAVQALYGPPELRFRGFIPMVAQSTTSP